MPARWFSCPAGVVEIEECLTQCPISEQLPAGRCLSLRTLRSISHQREWKGKPSTTQLIKGTREAYLEIVTDYAVDPQDRLFMVHGSRGHGYLEQFVGTNELSEERLHDLISSGMFDFYDPESESLFDSKFWGSYKVNKALGRYQKEVETGEYYKRDGKNAKKGDPKTRMEWFEGGVRHVFSEAIQLNDYRIKLEEVLPEGYQVKSMFIEALVRDGGLMVAGMRDIRQNGVLIPVNRISDHRIRKYMAKKAERLHHALETGETPNRCNKRESWSGRKCEKYCNVREACAKVESEKREEVAV